jgi:cell division protein ZapA
VLGRELQVKSTAPPEAVREIEGLVNSKLAAVSAAVTGGDTQVVAILTLMTLAEELIALKSEQEAWKNEGMEIVARTLEKLDSQI